MRKIIGFHKLDEPNAWMSNWYPSVFYIDGIRFSSVEQYLMYQKAVIFGDSRMQEAILATDDPQDIKDYGRLVYDYQDNIWAGRRQLVLLDGLRAKFSQNPKLKKKLLDTGDVVLAECAAHDKIFGIGIDLHDKRYEDRMNWTGSNILGYTLMQVRSELANAAIAPELTLEDHFWYEDNPDGGVTLFKPDGNRLNYNEKQRGFGKTKQMLAGWQRAMLFMETNGIWDATSFACSMESTLAAYWKDIEGEPVLLLFVTPQEADAHIYEHLTPRQVKQCRDNVKAFYASKEAQLAWAAYILYPVCFMIKKDHVGHVVPVSLKALYAQGIDETQLRAPVPVGMRTIDVNDTEFDYARSQELFSDFKSDSFLS